MTEKVASRLASVLGATSVVIGNINGSGDLEVRGKVQGNISTIGRIVVSSGGVVLGNIEATTLEVAGEVRGDLRANDGVQIASSGQVIGQIDAPRVGIEAGAIVRGQLTTGQLKAEQLPQAATPKPQADQLESRQKPKEGSHAPKAASKQEAPAEPVARAEEVEPELKAAPLVHADDAISSPAPAEQELAIPRPPKKRRRKPRTRSPAPLSDLPPSAAPEQRSEPRPEMAAAPLKPEQKKKEQLQSESSKNSKAELSIKAPSQTPSKTPQRASRAPGAAPKVPTFTKGTKGHRR